jgi:exodeoxyribonuclease-3
MSRIATWNVNSLRVRLPHLSDWLAETPLDIVGLQELKLQDSEFPHEALQAAGWHGVSNGQKTYNGVALLSRVPPEDVSRDIPALEDLQKRVIAASYGDLRVICAYVPNGQSVGSEKYAYKLNWLARFADYVGEELARHPKLVVLGDFNIAPTPEDTHDPEAWEGHILCSGPERAALQVLLDGGLHDAFHRIPTPEQRYTWWDYRAAGFRRNLGLRIDHILSSTPLDAAVRDWTVDLVPRKRERPSDHAPVIVEFAT